MSPRRIYLIFLIIFSSLLLISHYSFYLTPVVTDPNLPAPQELFSQVHTVAQRQRVIGYQRNYFAKDWGPSSAFPGCDSRQATIISQSLERNNDHPESRACTRSPTTIRDPYSGTILDTRDPLVRIEVDHVFPLSAAWDMGAWSWDANRRYEFANDPLNLVATAQNLNRDKSDSLPSQWLPPRGNTQCWYAQRLSAVALKYALTLDVADLRTMKKVCRL